MTEKTQAENHAEERIAALEPAALEQTAANPAKKSAEKATKETAAKRAAKKPSAASAQKKAAKSTENTPQKASAKSAVKAAAKRAAKSSAATKGTAKSAKQSTAKPTGKSTVKSTAKSASKTKKLAAAATNAAAQDASAHAASAPESVAATVTAEDVARVFAPIVEMHESDEEPSGPIAEASESLESPEAPKTIESLPQRAVPEIAASSAASEGSTNSTANTESVEEVSVRGPEAVAASESASGPSHAASRAKGNTRSTSADGAIRYGENLTRALAEEASTRALVPEEVLQGTADPKVEKLSETAESADPDEAERVEVLEGRRETIAKRRVEKESAAPIERLDPYIDDVLERLEPGTFEADMKRMREDVRAAEEAEAIGALRSAENERFQTSVDAELEALLERAALEGKTVDPQALRVEIVHRRRAAQAAEIDRTLAEHALVRGALFGEDDNPWYLGGIEAINAHMAGLLAYAGEHLRNEMDALLNGSEAESRSRIRITDETATLRFALREAEMRLREDIERITRALQDDAARLAAESLRTADERTPDEKLADAAQASPYGLLLEKRRRSLGRVAELASALAEDEARFSKMLADRLSDARALPAVHGDAAVDAMRRSELPTLERFTACLNGSSAENKMLPGADVPHYTEPEDLASDPDFQRGRRVGELLAKLEEAGKEAGKKVTAAGTRTVQSAKAALSRVPAKRRETDAEPQVKTDGETFRKGSTTSVKPAEAAASCPKDVEPSDSRESHEAREVREAQEAHPCAVHTVRIAEPRGGLLSGLFTGCLSALSAAAVVALYHLTFGTGAAAHPESATPRVAVVDRTELETRMAMMRVAAARPGEPESPELAALDGDALTKAIAREASERNSLVFSKDALLAMPPSAFQAADSSNENFFMRLAFVRAARESLAAAGLIDPPAAQTASVPSHETFDLTADIAAALGIADIDREALEKAFREHWLGHEAAVGSNHSAPKHRQDLKAVSLRSGETR